MIYCFEGLFEVLRQKIVCLQLRMSQSSQSRTKNQSTNLQVKQVIGLQTTIKNCLKSCQQSTIMLTIQSTIYNQNVGQIYRYLQSTIKPNPPPQLRNHAEIASWSLGSVMHQLDLFSNKQIKLRTSTLVLVSYAIR
jgi:hypothetical protein